MPPTLISPTTPLRTRKAGNFKIYLDPRISANQLALFAVSDPSKQETIIRNAKRMSKIPVANYQPARLAVSKSYDADGINAAKLEAEIERMETADFPELFESKCNKLSATALRRLLPMVSKIDCAGAHVARPARGFNHLLIEGVRVSVQPEAVFSFVRGSETHFGGVMVNFSKQESLARESGKYKAGHYAAFLVFQMLALHFASQGAPRVSHCFSVDVFRDEIYKAPQAQITMLKNLQAACRSIALHWDTFPIDGGAEPPSEEYVF